jgi:hypothetical protein
MLRAILGASLALIVTWLVSIATDEGQLSLGVRFGRTLLLAPFCSAVGVALAIAGSRTGGEIRALEAIGAPAVRSALAAVVGATLPAFVAAAALIGSSVIDVRPFYPQPPTAESFEQTTTDSFESRSLGVRINPRGLLEVLEEPKHPAENLPKYARTAAGLTIAVAGLAFSIAVARATVRMKPSNEPAERRRRVQALLEGALVAALTLIAFQAASARILSVLTAIVPPMAFLAVEVVRAIRERP